MQRSIKILFVCHGNICRSPIAEFVLKDVVQKKHLEDQFVIASAATTSEEIWGSVGNPVYPPARQELMRHGIGTPENELGVGAKRATLLRKSDYAKYDYIIGMDRENLYDMRSICGGDPEGKISLLLDYTDHPRDVADPWYTRDFRATWNDVEAGVAGLMEALRSRHLIHP